MNYRVEVEKSAKKKLEKLPKKYQTQILKSLKALESDPRPHGYIKMKGGKVSRYRMRIGSYRIVYQIKDKVLLVLVVDIGDRKEIYE